MRQEEHVDLGFPVKLEGLEDEVPQAEGLIVALGLEDPPVVREALLDEVQVVPLEVLEGRVLDVLQPPQGREGLGFICTVRGAPRAWPEGFRCLGPPVRGTRRPMSPMIGRRMRPRCSRGHGRRRPRRRRWGIASGPTSELVLRSRHRARSSRNERDRPDFQSKNGYGQAWINKQDHGSKKAIVIVVVAAAVIAATAIGVGVAIAMAVAVIVATIMAVDVASPAPVTAAVARAIAIVAVAAVLAMVVAEAAARAVASAFPVIAETTVIVMFEASAVIVVAVLSSNA